MSTSRIAVLGLGNLMRTDDAVGMLALQRLRADPRFPQSVLLIEGGTLGLELLYSLEGVTHLLALDAVDTGSKPGTLVRYSGTEIDGLPISKSVHLLGFSDLIGALRLTGSAPREIVMLGVQPEKIDWGTKLTQPVEAALATLVENAIRQVMRWSRQIAEEPHLPLPGNIPRMAAAAEEAWYW